MHLNEIINLWLWRWLQSSFFKDDDGAWRASAAVARFFFFIVEKMRKDVERRRW